ncbi:MAG: PTS mannose transporter subunit IID [Synergistaceae bacterium]|jgi:dihydroxyacetone kinase phosphotransfer subunit|nr:PTS mannose transporter subunit IID [Synergistaceae bacterium]
MVGILVVSHSLSAAEGIVQIALEMSGGSGMVKIAGIGGNDTGGLGITAQKILDSLKQILEHSNEVLILPDIGSSILSARNAIELLPPEDASKVIIADAPILEGALMAAIEASLGSDLLKVAASAGEARNLRKTDH